MFFSTSLWSEFSWANSKIARAYLSAVSFEKDLLELKLYLLVILYNEINEV